MCQVCFRAVLHSDQAVPLSTPNNTFSLQLTCERCSWLSSAHCDSACISSSSFEMLSNHPSHVTYLTRFTCRPHHLRLRLHLHHARDASESSSMRYHIMPCSCFCTIRRAAPCRVVQCKSTLSCCTTHHDTTTPCHHRHRHRMLHACTPFHFTLNQSQSDQCASLCFYNKGTRPKRPSKTNKS